MSSTHSIDTSSKMTSGRRSRVQTAFVLQGGERGIRWDQDTPSIMANYTEYKAILTANCSRGCHLAAS
jgi:hypothetical protein